MITVATLAEAQAVPNAVHVAAAAGAFNVYVQGDALPAHTIVTEPTEAEADAIFEQVEPQLADLNTQADNAIAANATFLALTSPTNAQTLAQVKALTHQNTRIIKALRRVVNRLLR